MGQYCPFPAYRLLSLSREFHNLFLALELNSVVQGNKFNLSSLQCRVCGKEKGELNDPAGILTLVLSSEDPPQPFPLMCHDFGISNLDFTNPENTPSLGQPPTDPSNVNPSCA